MSPAEVGIRNKNSKINVGVSKNRGTPKLMVKIMKTLLKMGDLGGFPPIFGNTHVVSH